MSIRLAVCLWLALGTIVMPQTSQALASSRLPLAAGSGMWGTGLADDSGLEATALAWAELPAMYEPGFVPAISLQRIPIDPGQHFDGREPNAIDIQLGGNNTVFGSHLIFVEKGAVVVTTPAGEQLVEPGASAYIPGNILKTEEIVPYDVRNDSLQCVVVWRVTYHMHGGAAAGIEPPPGPEVSCGEAHVAFAFAQSPQYTTWSETTPLVLFASTISIERGAYYASGYSDWAPSGPIVWLVQEGDLNVVSGGVHASATAGGWVGIPEGTPYSFVSSPHEQMGPLRGFLVGAVAV